MKLKIGIIVFGLLAISCNSIKKTKVVEGKKPNIIIIMADDMGFSDLGFMGSGIETPNIDNLKDNGILYTHFYNAGRCCPTRASLLTGLYAHKAGMGWMTAANLGTPAYQGDLSKNSVTIAEGLKEAGYATYMSGKWHVSYDKNLNQDSPNYNWPIQRGFDQYFGMLGGGGGYFDTKKVAKNNKIIELPDNFYLTSEITNNALEMLDNHFKTKKETPFFLYLAHYAPHRPLHALKDDIEKYKGKFMNGWDAIREEKFERMKAMGIADESMNFSSRDEAVKAWNELSEEEKIKFDARMSVYAAQIDRMDQGIGEVLKSLKENGELENTVIFFLSDNGGSSESQGGELTDDKLADFGSHKSAYSYSLNWANVSNTPFRGYKKENHEGGISTPLIVYWPNKIKKPSKTEQIGHVIDIMPTIMEIAGANYPKQLHGNKTIALQGKSLLKNLNNESVNRGAVFFEHQGDRAVILGDWKLVSSGTQKPPYTNDWELYNISVDRAESINLILTNQDKAKELEKLWNAWANENGVLPLDGRAWNERLKNNVNSYKSSN